MKKVILPLLLILAFGFLVAVESDPSAVVGYVRYDLVAGNNMVALPMECPWNMASELGDSFAGSVDQVAYWDAAGQIFGAAADLGGFWDGDFPIATNDVLMLYSYAAVPFYSLGNLPAPATYNLVAGNNTLMIPLNRPDLTLASELGADLVAGSVDQVAHWDASTQMFGAAADLGGFWDGDFAIGIAKPLMAYSYAPITWPSRGAQLVPAPSKARN
jgi:hypothetical protein